MSAWLLSVGGLLTQAWAMEQEVPLEVIPVNPATEKSVEPAPAPAARNRVVEEVVVTAQKREENPQDVPISMQAFSGEALAARGIETTAELGQAVPGLQFTGVSGFTLIFLRGIGTDNFIPSADPSVATYVDGIYLPAGQTTSQALGNVRRVEVLKGPQGTLFGRNATGGAISIVTEEPGDEFKVSGELEGGNFDRRAGRLSVSGPITDWLSAGLSGISLRKDSYYTAALYETQGDQLDAFRIKTNLHPTDDLSLALTLSRSLQRGQGSLIGNNTDPSLIGRLALSTPAEDDYSSETDFEGESQARQDLLYGTLNWSLPWLDMKLIGSDQKTHQLYASNDFDGSAIPLGGLAITNGFARLATAELQLLSNERTPGVDRFQWVSGLYYLRSRAGFDPLHLRAAPGALDAAFGLAGVELPQGLTDLFDSALLLNTPLGDNGVNLALRGLLETRSYSAYAQGTYFLNDQFDFTLGGRFQREKRYLIEASTGVVLPLLNEEVTLLPFRLPDAEISENFSPKAVLSFHPREDALVYLSYSVGYKSGTFNIINIYAPPNYIVPEKVTSFELGAKLDFLGGGLRVNGALFNNEIDNLQSAFVSLASGGAIRFLTAGAARTRGAELDVIWLPMAQTNPGLAITGNLAYVDATYTDFTDGSGFLPGSGLIATHLDFSGNEIVRAPKLSGGLGIVQAIELERSSVELAVDGYSNSGFYYDAFNTVEEKAYTLVNARISYLHAPWNLRTTLFGKNLLDERYHVQQFQTDFGINKTLAAPVEYGLRLTWEF
ncbi:MAG: TonB-dependent receptor [Panacagrimonas sp.]